MDQSEVRKEIRKYGQKINGYGGKPTYKTTCTVCGKELRSDAPADVEIGVSITRRGTAIFWCAKCKDKIWNSRMQ